MWNFPGACVLPVTHKKVNAPLLQKIKQEFREVKHGQPGQRFIDHFHRIRRREDGIKTFWKTFGIVAVGLLLVASGFLLSLPPGIPGFLLWIPGLALLSARSKPLAKLLDRVETWVRDIWHNFRNRR